MADTPEIENLSPDKLVAGFARTRIATCIILAVAVHLLVILLTSIGYIRSQLTVGPDQPPAEAKEAEKAATTEPTTKTQQKATTAATASVAKEQVGELEKRKQAPVVREITKMPRKGEIPKQPDDLGISIEETNP